MTRILLYLSILLCTSAFVSINSKKPKPKLPKEYAYIPAGTFWTGDQDSGKRITLMGFYMSKYEISNQQYKLFLKEVSDSLSEEEISEIMVDSTGWNWTTLPYHYGEPYRMNYFRHPAYNFYPVVNITHKGALKYCEWLQQKIQKENPAFTITVKLPSKTQWIWAAGAGYGARRYAWSGNYLRDKHGKFLCNFNGVDETAIILNKTTGQPEVDKGKAREGRMLSLANTKAYYPNDFCLYNVCGNAAEMVDSAGICMGGSWMDYGGDVTVTAQSTYNRSSPTVGFRPMIIATELPKK